MLYHEVEPEVQCAVVITTPAGEPIGVVACLGNERVTKATEHLLRSQGYQCESLVGVTGGDRVGPKAIVIQLVEGTRDGCFRKGEIAHVCQTIEDARDWLAEWYSNDGPAAKPVEVEWHWPRFAPPA